MLGIIEHDNIIAFHDRVMPRLLEQECDNCVLVGIITRLAQGKPATRSGESIVPLLLSIEDDGDVQAVAIQTPPHALLFTQMDAPFATALTEHLHARRWTGHQFSGILPAVRLIADLWQESIGQPYHLHLALRLFRTSEVIDPPRAAGSLRIATNEDLEIATQWVDSFGAGEIGEPLADPRRGAQIPIDEGRLHFWIDDRGEPRSMCAWQGPTPSSVRIGLVYTPPDFRGRGFASNSVAQVTRRQLVAGRSYCTLFTDLANPTSNSIYQKMGYRAVADFEHVKFPSSQP